MTYALMHIDNQAPGETDWTATDPWLEVSVVLSSERKQAVVVPLGHLRKFVPLIAGQRRPGDEPCCAGCGAPLDVPQSRDP